MCHIVCWVRGKLACEQAIVKGAKRKAARKTARRRLGRGSPGSPQAREK